MIFPEKLQEGDLIRIIAPSCSGSIVSEENKILAKNNLENLGLKVSFGKSVDEMDDFSSTSIENRVSDIHEAFDDKNIKGILSIIGGFNSNQLLKYIDWDLIKSNPKIFCGFSDVTALSNAMCVKSNLVTYSGMHFSTFGQKHLQEYNVVNFKKCLFSNEAFTVKPSEKWSDDKWYLNQGDRNFITNEGWWIINSGRAKGGIVGGNLATFRLLYGTEYMPSIKNKILFIEDDNYTSNDVAEFDRNLQSLLHQPYFESVKALVIGRFQIGSKMTKRILRKIIKSKSELSYIPIIANVDFGHTDPLFTFPIGGEVIVSIDDDPSLEFTKH